MEHNDLLGPVLGRVLTGKFASLEICVYGVDEVVSAAEHVVATERKFWGHYERTCDRLRLPFINFSSGTLINNV
jgi:hypothetical protein